MHPLVTRFNVRPSPLLASGIKLVLISALLMLGLANTAAATPPPSRAELDASVRKALPVLQRINQGNPPSVADVRAAQIGPLEPVVVEIAEENARIRAMHTEYTQAVQAERVQQFLGNPAQLSSPQARDDMREILARWQTALDLYARRISELLQGSAARMKAIVDGPDLRPVAAAFLKGYDRANEVDAKQILAIPRNDQDCLDVVLDFVDFMDGADGRYAMSTDGKPHLVFMDQADLDHFNTLKAKVFDVLQRARNLQARLDQRRQQNATSIQQFMDKP